MRRRKTKNGVARAKKIKITYKGDSYLIKDIMKKKKRKRKKEEEHFLNKMVMNLYVISVSVC